MVIGKLIKLFVPKEKTFFPIFEEGSENLVKVAVLLKKLIEATDEIERKELAKSIKELEVVGDKITSNIYETLNLTFITPFDREEIHDLASAIDDFADQINSTSQKINLYKLSVFTPDFIQIADILVESANYVNDAVKGLKDMKNHKKIDAACVQVSLCENKVDDLYHKAISDFFENESDAKELIKKKAVLESMEKSADRAERIANVIRTILIKIA